MPNFMDLVNSRYSCRDYCDKKVPREDILKCLEAARLAPSACNSQPWKFIIVDEPSLKAELTEAAFTAPYTASWPKNAPLFLVVASNTGSFMTKVGNMVRDTRYYLLDLGIAIEHFVLQATELGLGTCWMGWFNEKGVKKVLGLPASSRVEIIMPIGYPNKKEEKKKIRKKMEEISRFNNNH